MIPRFRAWDKESKTMDTVRRITWTDADITDVYLENVGLRRLDQVNIMQYTGLKDKNGVDIYEGDIVRWLKEFISPMDMRTKLKIDSNKEVHRKESGEWGMGEAGSTLTGELFNVEVIGNIYENPELLEVAE